jgi:hypothetical protein
MRTHVHPVSLHTCLSTVPGAARLYSPGYRACARRSIARHRADATLQCPHAYEAGIALAGRGGPACRRRVFRHPSTTACRQFRVPLLSIPVPARRVAEVPSACLSSAASGMRAATAARAKASGRPLAKTRSYRTAAATTRSRAGMPRMSERAPRPEFAPHRQAPAEQVRMQARPARNLSGQPCHFSDYSSAKRQTRGCGLDRGKPEVRIAEGMVPTRLGRRYHQRQGHSPSR